MDPSGEKIGANPAEKENAFSDKVLKAADRSYGEVAKNLEIDLEAVFSSRRCEQVSQVLKRELDAEGIDSSIARYVGWDIVSHELLISNIDGEKFIIDPTWQQFLDKPDSSKPKVLISPREEIERRLTELGVPIDKHHIWKDVKIPTVESPPE